MHKLLSLLYRNNTLKKTALMAGMERMHQPRPLTDWTMRLYPGEFTGSKSKIPDTKANERRISVEVKVGRQKTAWQKHCVVRAYKKDEKC